MGGRGEKETKEGGEGEGRRFERGEGEEGREEEGEGRRFERGEGVRLSGRGEKYQRKEREMEKGDLTGEKEGGTKEEKQ